MLFLTFLRYLLSLKTVPSSLHSQLKSYIPHEGFPESPTDSPVHVIFSNTVVLSLFVFVLQERVSPLLQVLINRQSFSVYKNVSSLKVTIILPEEP